VVIAQQELQTPVAGLSWEGLDIGRDLRMPVSPRYAAPFPYRGELREVVFEID
jgi:hypothetical protein